MIIERINLSLGKDCIGVIILLCTSFLSCKNETLKPCNNIDNTEEAALINVFLAHPLSQNYSAYNHEWRKELTTSLYPKVYIWKDLESYFELREVSDYRSSNEHYNLIIYASSIKFKKYIFPIMDDYYYNRLNLLKDTNESCNRCIEEFYKNITLQRHLNYIFETEPIFKDFNLSNQYMLDNLDVFVSTLLDSIMKKPKITDQKVISNAISSYDLISDSRNYLLFFQNYQSKYVFKFYTLKNGTLKVEIKLLDADKFERAFF